MNLFAYGTLMVPEIMHEVSGCAPQPVEVTLEGYQRCGIRNEQYPGMIETAGGRVDGILYLDVPPEAMRRLDLFEGEMYSRETVRVRRKDDRNSLEAMTYVIRSEFTHLLTGEAWDLQNFLKHGRALFESAYIGYNELKRG